MANYAPNLEDGDFHNWLKSALAVLFTKEGLEDFVFDEITGLQQDLLQDIYKKYGIPAGTTCSKCSTANILRCKTKNFCPPGNKECNMHDSTKPKSKPNQPCPVNLCLHLKDAIKKEHRYGNPSWKNTDATGWCRDPFQLSKCFMPPDGYDSVSSINETDFNGVVNVMLNSKRFKTKFADNLDHEPNVCDEARSVARTVRHSPNLLASDSDFGNLVDAFIALLTDKGHLSTKRKAQEAVTKITKLKADTLSVESSYLSQIIEDTIRESTGRSLKAIETAKLKVLEEIREVSARQNMTIEDIRKSFNERLLHCQLTAVFVQTNIQTNMYSHVAESSGHSERSVIPYDTLTKDLQKDLITFYVEQYNFISVSPVLPENDARLLDIYVEPTMEISSWNVPDRTWTSHSRMPVLSYKDIFMNGQKLCRNIYICAHAGIGKTTYAQRLCVTWCCVHGNLESGRAEVTKEDAEAMKMFDFLFFLPLRYVRGSDCDLDTMICNQILENLSHQTDQYAKSLQDILHQENCLVIFDGLDEWSHPKKSSCKKQSDIPHRRSRDKCTILSTTREWKMHEAKIGNSKVDKYIIMKELNDVSAGILIGHVVYSLTGSNERVESAQNYISQIKQRGKSLADLASTPLILVHLLCLWHDGRSIGESMCSIYCNVVEFMLQYTNDKLRDTGASGLPKDENLTKMEVPVRLRNYENVCKFYTFLLMIAELAFTALFNPEKESSLVIDYSNVRSFLSEDQLRYCLQMGLLTENRPRLKSTRQSTFSFLHKSFQDFFAALFLESRHLTLIKDVRIFCYNIERIVEMTNVYVFLGGVNCAVLESIFEKLACVVQNDSMVRKYRGRLAVMNSNFENTYLPFKRYQDMCITCFCESAPNFVKLPIEDFIVTTDIQSTDYFRSLNSLLQMNVKRAQSLLIENLDFKTTQRFLYNFDYNLMDRISSITLITELESYFVESFLVGSAETLQNIILHSDKYLNGKQLLPHRLIPLSDVSLNALQAATNLQILILECFILRHDQLERLVKFLTDKKSLRQIGLGAVICREHGNSCSGFPINLSLHWQLFTLELGDVPLSFVRVNASLLEECNLGDFQNENILPSIFDCLKNAVHLKSIEFFDMNNVRNIETVLCNLNSDMLCNIQVIEMNYVDLTSKIVQLSSAMVNLKCIWLQDVKMSVNSLVNIVKTVFSFPNTVLVYASDCTFSPSSDYEIVKQKILSSKKCEVITDTRYEFRFKVMNAENKIDSF